MYAIAPQLFDDFQNTLNQHARLTREKAVAVMMEVFDRHQLLSPDRGAELCRSFQDTLNQRSKLRRFDVFEIAKELLDRADLGVSAAKPLSPTVLFRPPHAFGDFQNTLNQHPMLTREKVLIVMREVLDRHQSLSPDWRAELWCSFQNTLNQHPKLSREKVFEIANQLFDHFFNCVDLEAGATEPLSPTVLTS